MRIRSILVFVALFATASPSMAWDQVDIDRLNNREGCPGCDLADANLNGMDLGNQDLSGANLSNANMTGVSLVYTNLSDANLFNANVRSANLTGTNFSGADLAGAIFTGVHELNMEGLNLTNAKQCSTTWIDGSVNNTDC
jgi:BTB/POZ domain-containing protein KCTD9